MAGSPNVTVCEPAQGGSNRKSTSGLSTSPRMPKVASLWRPTANKRSRSPSGPRGRLKTETSDPEAPGAAEPGATRGPTRSGRPQTAPGTEDPPSSRTSPKSHRVAAPAHRWRGPITGRYRRSGGSHPRQGDADHGNATTRSIDPGKDLYLAWHPPPSSRDRANAPTHWSHRESTRTVTGIQQAIGVVAPHFRVLEPYTTTGFPIITISCLKSTSRNGNVALDIEPIE